MGLEIKDETVYVIYRNGTPYNTTGRKIVYTFKGAAKGVITNEAKDIAQMDYAGDWYELSRSKREKLIENVTEEFEIIEYVPKE